MTDKPELTGPVSAPYPLYTASLSFLTVWQTQDDQTLRGNWLPLEHATSLKPG